MANREHLAKLKKSRHAWNKWREKIPRVRPDLDGAELGGTDLSGADLSQADLSDADLSGADLRGVDLSGADLIGANLEQAVFIDAYVAFADLSQTNLEDSNLSGSNFVGAILVEASLVGADLQDVNLDSADLSWADLTDAAMGNTVLGDNDLSNAHGLETVEHSRPSTVGSNTIFRSKGNIPELFMRGCGVPDEFITYMKSLAANPIEFYSCFISYSTKDQDFAERLHADLQNKGVRCWFAPHDVQSGKKLHEQIDEAIRLHDKLLLILSPYSMESEWVKAEIAKARKREVHDQRRVLFPMRLVPFETLRGWECFDADTGKDSAREIREYFIPDFSTGRTTIRIRRPLQR